MVVLAGQAGNGICRRRVNALASASAQGQCSARRRKTLRWPRVIRAAMCNSSVAQRLGSSPVQLGLVDEQHRLGEGEEVRGDQRKFDPDLVDPGVPGG